MGAWYSKEKTKTKTGRKRGKGADRGLGSLSENIDFSIRGGINIFPSLQDVFFS
jgi:hypothetical protein